MKLVMIDNYDSFTYNIVQYFGELGQDVKVYRNDAITLDEIARLDALQGAQINEAKKVLATEATAIIHGREAAEQAAQTAHQAFELGESAESLPTIVIPAADLGDGIGVLAAFVRAGLCSSIGEARRLVRGGGIKVNDAAITDDRQQITIADLASGSIKLSMG